MEFELANYDITVPHFDPYTTRTPHIQKMNINVLFMRINLNIIYRVQEGITIRGKTIN